MRQIGIITTLIAVAFLAHPDQSLLTYIVLGLLVAGGANMWTKDEG